MYHIAITGHRPKDLGGLNQGAVRAITFDMLDRAEARAGGNDICIHTGGALGIDTWVALTVQNSPYYGLSVKHTLHLPFTPDIMTTKWTQMQTNDLMLTMKQASALCTKCPHPTYDPAFYQRRNEHMVDESNVLVAYWTGKRNGGTWNCIAYAIQKNVPVYNALDSMEKVRL